MITIFPWLLVTPLRSAYVICVLKRHWWTRCFCAYVTNMVAALRPRAQPRRGWPGNRRSVVGGVGGKRNDCGLQTGGRYAHLPTTSSYPASQNTCVRSLVYFEAQTVRGRN